MNISTITGKYYAAGAGPLQTPFPGEPKTINVGVESWLLTTNPPPTPASDDRIPGIPEEFDEDISLDPALSFLSLWDAVENESFRFPIKLIDLDQQTMFVQFDGSDWGDYWNTETNQLEIPEGSEIWLALNPTKTWPKFWDGRLRPSGAMVFVGPPYA